MAEKPAWQDPAYYANYMKSFRETYEKEPLIQASLQLILSVFAVAFFIFLAIRPTLATITTLIKKIDEQKVVDQKLDAKIAQLNEAQEAIGIYGDELELLLNKAVPLRPVMDTFSKEVEAIALESGAKITGVSVDSYPLVGKLVSLTEKGIKPAIGKQSVGFTINGGGDSAQIEAFLRVLEKMERVVNIDQAEISRPESRAKGNFPLVFSIKGEVFYLDEEVGK